MKMPTATLRSTSSVERPDSSFVFALRIVRAVLLYRQTRQSATREHDSAFILPRTRSSKRSLHVTTPHTPTRARFVARRIIHVPPIEKQTLSSADGALAHRTERVSKGTTPVSRRQNALRVWCAVVIVVVVVRKVHRLLLLEAALLPPVVKLAKLLSGRRRCRERILLSKSTGGTSIARPWVRS